MQHVLLPAEGSGELFLQKVRWGEVGEALAQVHRGVGGSQFYKFHPGEREGREGQALQRVWHRLCLLASLWQGARWVGSTGWGAAPTAGLVSAPSSLLAAGTGRFRPVSIKTKPGTIALGRVLAFFEGHGSCVRSRLKPHTTSGQTRPSRRGHGGFQAEASSRKISNQAP